MASVVQSAASSGFSDTVTFDVGVTEGNSIIMAVGAYDGVEAAFGSGNPTLGGTLYPGAMLVQQNTSPQTSNMVYEAWWILPNIPASLAGQTELEFFPNQEPVGIIAFEVAGLGPNPQLDQYSQGAGNGTVADSGATPATMYESEIVLGCAVGYGESFNAPSVPWTSQIGPSGYFWAGYQLATESGGSYDWQQDANSGGNNWTAGIISVYASPQPTLSVVQVQTEAANVNSISFATDVTPGNTIVFSAVAYSTDSSPYDMSDVQLGGSSVPGTVLIQRQFVFDSDTNQAQEQYIWMIPNCPGGQDTISFSFTSNINSICAVEVAGLGPNPVVDQSVYATGSSASVSSGTTAPIAAAPEFIFGGAGMFSGSYSPPEGLWTYININASGYAGYQVATVSGGTYSWQQPVSDGSTAWGGGVVAIRASVASGLMMASFL